MEFSEKNRFKLSVLLNLSEIPPDVADFLAPPAVISSQFISPFIWYGYKYQRNKIVEHSDGSVSGHYICTPKKRVSVNVSWN
jgi:hypothetical protein